MKKYIYSIIALLMVTWCSAQMFVSQAEYFWDTDPGAGNGTPVSATDGSFSSTFEQLTKTGVATPGNGLHKLCIRIKDNTGVWGPVFTNIINVQQTLPSTIMAIALAEYFWDTDPGTGNGTPVLAADGNFNGTYEQLTRTGIALPSAGLHVFNIRIKDNTGVWGPVFKNVIDVQTTTLSGCWKSISAGNTHSLGIKTDGTLWAWGANNEGQLGDGTNTARIVPKQIGTATNWKKIVTGAQYTIGLKTNGTLWAWGYNSVGQLGNGTTVDRNVPTQIGTAADWTDIASGVEHTFAIKANGTLWGWGNNGNGQLGDGTTVNKTVPTQIGTSTNWQSVTGGNSFSLGIRTNGTLWAWGLNNYGQLGDGTTVSKAIPVQIGTATGWTNVSAGYNHSVAKNANGSLYTWGANGEGQLGDGTNTNRSTPAAVFDQVQSIDAGWYHTVGITTYGNIFTCGDNNFGQFGNNTTNTSNWISVGNDNDYKMVSAGALHTLIINNNDILKAAGNNDSGQIGDGTTVQKNVFTALACPVSNLSTDEISTITDHLKVYPNPVHDNLTISFDKNISSVTIYNMVGQQVLTKAINANKTTLDVSSLSSGVYLVIVNSGSEIKTLKVIKK